jgi:hypothetical protein
MATNLRTAIFPPAEDYYSPIERSLVSLAASGYVLVRLRASARAVS